MATYTVWYTEETTYKAWFEANDLAHAKELLDKVNKGEIYTEDLKEFSRTAKDSGLSIGFDYLEEVSNA
jgi:hypothetical protein